MSLFKKSNEDQNIAMAAYPDNEDKNRVLEADCVDFITKPITLEELNAKCLLHMKKLHV